MNFLFVIHSLRGGGAERVVLDTTNFLTQKGHQSYIIILNNKIDFEIDDNSNIIYLDISDYTEEYTFIRKILNKAGLNYKDYIYLFYKSTLISRKLENKIKDIENENKFKFDKIFVHSILASLSLSKLRFRTNVIVHSQKSKYLLNKSNLIHDFILKKIMKHVYNRNLFTVSHGIKSDLEKEFSIYHSKVVYNPFDFSLINKKSSQLDENVFDLFGDYIISVGSLIDIKRQDLLIDAFKKVSSQYPNLKLLIVGKGILEMSLKKQAHFLGLEDKIIFYGFLKNPYPFIRRAKLLVCSSDFEGLPTVIIEALSLNTAVVSTNCPSGPDEIMTGDLSQYLAKVGDKDDLSEKILLALNNYPTKLNSYVQKFDKETVLNELLTKSINK